MGNVVEDVPNVDERDDLKLICDRAGGGCGQSRNESQYFIKKNEIERSGDGVEIVGSNLGEQGGRMGEGPGDKDQNQMQGKACNAKPDDIIFEDELVGFSEIAVMKTDGAPRRSKLSLQYPGRICVVGTISIDRSAA